MNTRPLPLRFGVLGSGVLLPDDRARSSGHWLSAEAGEGGENPFRLLLDCGSGTLHGMARDGLPWRELTHLVLSHFHTDHTGDLAAVLWALRWGMRREGEGSRERPLHLVGPPGLTRRMEGLAMAHGEWIREPGTPLELHEVVPGRSWFDQGCGLRLVSHPARHTPEALAWRVEARDTAVGYTGDTGPLPSLGAFFRGVELLVAECALPDPPPAVSGAEEGDEADGPRTIHLTPGTLAPLARTAGPGLLVTVHHYPELDRERVPDLLRAGGYPGPLQVGHDGLALAVGPSEVRNLAGSLTFP